MPVFQFKKLVRDKLPLIYEQLGEKIIARKLKGRELRVALKHKLIEEVSEIPADIESRDDVIAELADASQLLGELKREYNVTDGEVDAMRSRKFSKKGGFSEGIFVETIELNDEDEWVAYYRKEPLKYPEIKPNGKVDPDLPELEKGTYRHSKSGQLYEVLGVTFNTETYEPLVIYRPLYSHGKYDLFARPYEIFIENVVVDGETLPRFEKAED